jgi:hypothetical protein
LVFVSRNKHLNDLERSIIEGVCQGKKYSQIAQDNYCEQSHVNDVATDLWKALSNVVGAAVKKANFRATIERYRPGNSSSLFGQISSLNFCSEVRNHPNIPQYLKTIPALIPFYARSQELTTP